MFLSVYRHSCLEKSPLKLSVSVEVIATCQICPGSCGFERERTSVEVNKVAASSPPVITHRLEGGGSVTDCKSCFRPEAGKMSPAPSGLQAVDGLNHLHESLRLGF